MNDLAEPVARLDAALRAVDHGAEQAKAALTALTELEGRLRAAAEALGADSPALPDDPSWRAFGVCLPGGQAFSLVLESDDISAYLNGEGQPLDVVLIELMLQLVAPGDRVLDLGANVGGFSLAAAAAGCAGLAVEASPTHAALLASSAWRNGFHDLHVVNAAAGAGPGFIEFVVNGPWSHVAWGTEPGSVRVPALAVDDLAAAFGWDTASFVKMDVEGSELDAIAGMRRLLGGPDAPPLLYESNGHMLGLAGHTPRRLTEALGALGYGCYLIDEDRRRLTAVGPNDPQFQTVANGLALKGDPPALAGWTFAAGLTTEELIAQAAAESRHPNVACRLHAARALAAADPDFLAVAEVRSIVNALLDDPDAGVRGAAGTVRVP